jgi:hypothetical protein
MKLRLFPRQEDAYFPLFEAAADTIAAAATVLLDRWCCVWSVHRS